MMTNQSNWKAEKMAAAAANGNQANNSTYRSALVGGIYLSDNPTSTSPAGTMPFSSSGNEIDSSVVDIKPDVQMRGGTPEPANFIPFGPDDLELMNPSSKTTRKKMGGKKKNKPRYFNQGDDPNPNAQPEQRKRRGFGLSELQGGIKKPKLTVDKNAMQILNELHPKLEFVFGEQTGPSHQPCFTVQTYFQQTSKEYSAQGRSKKDAKNNCAAKILEDLGIEVPKPSEKNRDSAQPSSMFEDELDPNSHSCTQQFESTAVSGNIDFASDDLFLEDDFNAVAATTPIVPNEGQLSYILQSIDPKILSRIKNIPNLEENSCLAINSLNLSPGPVPYEFISEDGPPHAKVFTYRLPYLDAEFIGKGCSKKRAKADCARQALVSILGPRIFQALNSLNPTAPASKMSHAMNSMDDSMNIDNAAIEVDPESLEYNVAFSDHVHRIVNEKYELVMRDDVEHKQQKVLAGIVMTKGSPIIETATVIVVTAGTKCIEGDCLSDIGVALNDCHAEILATRCLRDFFYYQIDALLRNKDKPDTGSIFTFAETKDPGKRFKLKDEVKFHLFINTSPCGDARIFSPKGLDENNDSPHADSHPNRINRGLLRAKIEAGEGTIPVTNLPKGPQTWDAILQGNALNTMSCSDKLCRWNALGIQGALLANLMDPIYYSSIVLGSLHHPVHFRRAVIGRIDDLETKILPSGYKLNKPHLLMVSSEEKRRVKKSPNHAITWCTSWSSHEVLMAPKGRVKAGNTPSRVSKRQAYIRFLNVLKTTRDRLDLFTGISYGDAKNKAQDYQVVKRKFLELTQEANLGNWIGKPEEIDSFYID